MRLALAACLLLFSVSPASAATLWFSGSVITNPTTNAVLVTSTPLQKGTYAVSAYVYSDVGAAVLVQHLNTAGAVLQNIIVPASPAFILFQAPLPLVVDWSETVRVVSRGNVIGEAQAVLFVSGP